MIGYVGVEMVDCAIFAATTILDPRKGVGGKVEAIPGTPNVGMLIGPLPAWAKLAMVVAEARVAMANGMEAALANMGLVLWLRG